MARRLGFGSSANAPVNMIVTNTPAADLALTNFAYCSPSDLRRFSSESDPRSKLVLASVGDSVVLTTGQRVSFDYFGTNYIYTVTQAQVEGQDGSNAIERGMVSTETYFVFEASPTSGIKIVNQREAVSSNIFRQKEFNLEKLGIGGLSAEFADIFRRAFSSRVFPPHVMNKLGVNYVKGMLLYWPPGTGKTLIARQIGKMLNGREPKI